MVSMGRCADRQACDLLELLTANAARSMAHAQSHATLLDYLAGGQADEGTIERLIESAPGTGETDAVSGVARAHVARAVDTRCASPIMHRVRAGRAHRAAHCCVCGRCTTGFEAPH